MICSSFSDKFRGLLCAGIICLPFVVRATDQLQAVAKPQQLAQATVANNPPAATTPLANNPVTATPPVTPKPAVVTPPPYTPPPVLTNLVFDAETKEFKAKQGDSLATFSFHITNNSDVPVHITGVAASCGCTAAQLPPMPWVIQPHSNDVLNATMTLAGKPPGEVTKVLTINSTNGVKQVFVKSIIPKPETGTEADRQKNMELAKADRQAIFKNDCAKCHVEKSKGLVGAPLYKEACGICHDSPARAQQVPDLHNLNHPTDAAFWKTITADGKPNTLMPAFSTEHGGPLSKEQIDSLVAYLTTDFAKEKSTPQTKLPPAAPAAQPPHAAAPPLPPGIPGKSQVVTFPTVQPLK